MVEPNTKPISALPGNTLIDNGVGYISAASYPFFLPYRLNGDSKGSMPSGRTPRLLTVFFTTLVHTHDGCYDPETRVLRFHRGFRQLSKLFGVFQSITSHKLMVDNLRLMNTAMTFPNNPNVKLFEEWHEAELTSDMWIKFTVEYAHMLDQMPMEVPLIALKKLHSRPFETDLIALAALYSLEDRQLMIPFDTVERILPISFVDKKHDLNEAFDILNHVQESWRFTKLTKRISIKPAHTKTTVSNAVTLTAVPVTSDTPNRLR